jgi:lysophospholipase L1-like esterase
MLDRGTFLKLAATVPILPGSMMFATPRILVLGDSVTWGQGLNANQKMQKQLAAMFYYQNGVEPQILSYAHSGGTIGFEDGVPTKPVIVPDWWPREIPRANPTIHEQSLLVEEQHRDRRFDYVILAGGINDVSVMTIFNPATGADEIRSRSAYYCHDQLLVLLNELWTTFGTANPAVKILVLGYYPVLTNQSAIPNVLDVLKALARETINPPRPHGFLAETLGTDWNLRRILIQNSIAFRDASRTDISSAVVSANAKASTQAFIYVDPAIADDEAAFAPNALLWGLQPGTEVPTDPVYDDRIRYCKDLIGEAPGIDQFKCERASLGHPNITGAMRYAQNIFSAIAVAAGQAASPAPRGLL